MDPRTPEQIESANQRIVERLRIRDVHTNVAYVVDTVQKLYSAAPRKVTDLVSIDYEQLDQLSVRRGTPEEVLGCPSNTYSLGKLDDENWYWYAKSRGKPFLGTAPGYSAIELADGTWQGRDSNDDLIAEPRPTEKEALNDTWERWLQEEDQGFFDTSEEAAQDCCDKERLRPEEYDADHILFYAVSDCLAEHLREEGETVVEDCMGLEIWCLTGHNVDSTLMRVARKMGILVGGKYSWDPDENAYRNRHRYRLGELVWWSSPEDPNQSGAHRIIDEVDEADTLQIITVCPIKVVHRVPYSELTPLPQPSNLELNRD